MKEIVKIVINKEIEKEVKVEKTDESGKEITVLEKVKEQIPQNYILAKPSFSLRQESTLYYESIVAECTRRGIFSTIQLRKRFVDDDLLSSQERKIWDDNFANLWLKKAELKKLDEDKEKNSSIIKNTEEEIDKIISTLQKIEERSGNSMVYEHTAEKIASDRTVIWWMLFLSYKDNNGKFEPVFGNGKYEDKLKVYEEFDKREDPFELELINKLLLASSLWAFNKAQKQEEFDEIFKKAEQKL